MQSHIQHIQQFDSSLIPHINSLLKQLTTREISFNEEDLRLIIDSASSQLFILRVEGEVAGMLTLGIYATPTGRKLWIEDVVVDNKFRGRGFGHTLIRHAIDYAKGYAPCSLILTSNPKRVEANALYRSEGFELRNTNVYKMDI